MDKELASDSRSRQSLAREQLLVRFAGRYAMPLRRFFLRRAIDVMEVPDLVQEVFLRLAKMPDPTAIQKPDQFLFTAAINVLRDHTRNRAARGVGKHDPLDGGSLASSDIPIDRVLEGREAASRLQAALLELPERTRDIFVLRVLEGMKMADVAAAIGISTRAAEKHQAKALAHVTLALEEWRHP